LFTGPRSITHRGYPSVLTPFGQADRTATACPNWSRSLPQLSVPRVTRSRNLNVSSHTARFRRQDAHCCRLTGCGTLSWHNNKTGATHNEGGTERRLYVVFSRFNTDWCVSGGCCAVDYVVVQVTTNTTSEIGCNGSGTLVTTQAATIHGTTSLLISGSVQVLGGQGLDGGIPTMCTRLTRVGPVSTDVRWQREPLVIKQQSNQYIKATNASDNTEVDVTSTTALPCS
jgi:hypothetical protein